MKRLTFIQGSPEWHAHRATARNASDAPAVLGCSKYQTRQELLHARHTGLRAEPDAALARRYADGHAIEAAQRDDAAAMIGEPLYPVVGCDVVDGLELSASFDGLTMAEDVAYECKTLNEELRACMPNPGTDDNDARDLPKMYRVQMEQQLAVSGAERVLFVAATKDGSDVRRCWYYPDHALRAEIIAGWKQFDADLAAYVPPAASNVEKIVAEPVEALPAVFVKVEGTIAIRENFDVFEKAARHFVDHKLIQKPTSDQDFADLEQQIKTLKQAREAIKSGKAQMLAQISPVDEANKRADMLDDLLQKHQSLSERLLKEEKERRKLDIVTAGANALVAHIAALNTRLGKTYMPAVQADFAGCVRGLKSLTSMEDKVAHTLANAKIEANAIADKIDINLQHLREHAGEYRALFPDTAALVLRTPEDCALIVQARITEHKAAEERRAAELAERERARIRAEEEARAAEKVRQEQAAREAEERRQRIAAEEQQRQQQAEKEATTRAEPEAKQLPAAAPANVVPMPTRAPAAPAAPTLMLREINARIAPLSIDAAGLASLGFAHAGTDRAAKLYHEADFAGICLALVKRLQSAANEHATAA